MIRYEIPPKWLPYDISAVAGALIEAKAAVLSLSSIPYQRPWVEALQEIQLKREIAGTSRIEGADFTDRELDAAMKEDHGGLQTRSQRQARAAVSTYRWIARLDDDRPIDGDLIREVHRRIVTDADDDHCAPGVLRGPDHNVTFGVPPHRGAEGGTECEAAFAGLTQALSGEFRRHDSLVQALALHYHFAAMHPFLDGNGRTARALEALMLQRAGLRDSLFIAMSNYYYDEKPFYLRALSDVRANGYDLTAFLVFGLAGIRLQCGRLFKEIRANVAKAVYINLAHDLFGRMKSTRKRVIADRQIKILRLLLAVESMAWKDLVERALPDYQALRHPDRALIRDIVNLLNLGAITRLEGAPVVTFAVRLSWPEEITETKFFATIKTMPKAKTRWLMLT